MSEISEKVDAVRRLAAGYQAVIELSDLMISIGNLDSAAEEAKARAEKERQTVVTLRDERDALEARLKTGTEELDAVKKQTVEFSQSFEELRERMIGKAKADAEAEASKVLDDAKAAAEAHQREASASIAKAQNDANAVLSSIGEKIETKTRDLDGLNLQIAMAQETLAQINAEVERVRSSVLGIGAPSVTAG